MKFINVFIFCFLSISVSFGQNVGINTLQPSEILHLRTDTQNVVIRFDNRKSDITGTTDTTIICSPTAVSQTTALGNVNWQNLDIINLNASDDIYIESDTILSGDLLEDLVIVFGCDFEIPVDATINTGTLYQELGANYNDPSSIGSLSYQGLVFKENDFSSYFILGLLAPFLGDTPFTFSIPSASDFTPVDINNNNLKFLLRFIPSSAADFNILIDKMEVELNYSYPSLGTEEVRWSAGVQNGKFNISNSKNITKNQYLSINQSGLTRLKSLQITDNAANDKILTSTLDGTAIWRFPFELGLGQNLIWFQASDTAVYNIGPVKIDNSDILALSFDDGMTSFQNADNLLLTQREKLNFIIDTENQYTDDAFAIFNDKSDASNAPIVKFNLEGDQSWINSGDLGVKTNNPNTDLHLVHDIATETDGFKIQQKGTNQFWRMFTGAGGQLFLFNTNSPNVPIGAFSEINGAYTALSDARAKRNIRDLDSVIPSLRNIYPKRYEFKHMSSHEESIGLIAQEIMKYFPEAVKYHQELDSYTVDYSVFSVVALKAVKELDERILKLEKMMEVKLEK